ncbi:hypothetical protein CR513_51964, partial [Mucuna pruriens]
MCGNLFLSMITRASLELGYNQQEGIDFTETFNLVTRLEAIRILLAFASYKNIKLFQMDVKSSFLNEEIYFKQPPSFEDLRHPKHINIIFKATNENLCKDLFVLMQNKFEISMMGEIKFFLGVQVKQEKEGIHIYQ